MKKYKQKTRKAITKRFKVTKSGKVLRMPSGQDHLSSKQASSKRRRLTKLVEVAEPEAKKIKKLLKI